MDSTVKNKKLDDDVFLKERQEVLAMWPTGKEVDLDEAVEYQKGLSDNRNFAKVAARLHEEGRTVVFPRAGTPILEDEIALVQTLVATGLPLVPVTPIIGAETSRAASSISPRSGILSCLARCSGGQSRGTPGLTAIKSACSNSSRLCPPRSRRSGIALSASMPEISSALRCDTRLLDPPF